MILFPIYDFFLLLFAFSYFPRALLDANVREKLTGITLTKFGFRLPKKIPKNQHVIWIHAASVGEVKAASTLELQIRSQYPNSKLVVSTSTKTGLKQAYKSFKSLEDAFILPLDFIWACSRLLNRLHPNLLLFSEGDLWPRFVLQAKKRGCKIAIVNARMSKLSLSRYQKIPRFFWFFDAVDLFCCQNALYYDRLIELGIPKNRLELTGNLKFDLEIHKKPHPLFKKLEQGQVLALVSTHEKEEKLLIDSLKKWIEETSSIQVVIAPRHIQRAKKIQSELKDLGLQFSITSQDLSSSNRLWILDEMGVVPALCEFSFATIVGGSFVPIGGHDIIEPIKSGSTPVFGPHMFKQEEMKQLVLEDCVGVQTQVSTIAAELAQLLKESRSSQGKRDSQKQFLNKIEGAANLTWKKLYETLEA